MNVTKVLQSAQRTPLIKFVGKRTVPKSVDHTPTVHPASPKDTLPNSFANYRSKAQQHGPLTSHSSDAPSKPLGSRQQPWLAYGAIGGSSGHSLGKVDAPEGLYFDRSELPKRFGRTPWTQVEIDAIETGGASMWT